jgi:hypothetical protein
MNCERCIVWYAIPRLAAFFSSQDPGDQRFRPWRRADSADGADDDFRTLRSMATNHRAAGVELQFSRNELQGRRVGFVVAAAQIGKKTLSCRQ